MDLTISPTIDMKLSACARVVIVLVLAWVNPKSGSDRSLTLAQKNYWP